MRFDTSYSLLILLAATPFLFLVSLRLEGAQLLILPTLFLLIMLISAILYSHARRGRALTSFAV